MPEHVELATRQLTSHAMEIDVSCLQYILTFQVQCYSSQFSEVFGKIGTVGADTADRLTVIGLRPFVHRRLIRHDNENRPY